MPDCATIPLLSNSKSIFANSEGVTEGVIHRTWIILSQGLRDGPSQAAKKLPQANSRKIVLEATLKNENKNSLSPQERNRYSLIVNYLHY